jgi:threonyl-tRNA synthetase
MRSVREALEEAGLLGGRVIGARLGDRVLDLHEPAPGQEAPGPVRATDDDPDALHILRHSAAHVMAAAVQDLWPGTQVTIGPTIRDGFYYDFDRDTPFSREEFGRIEERMREQIEADLPMVREEVAVGEAIELFRGKGEHYKVEIIEDLVRDEGVETVSLYRHGDWVDLCRGPHLPSTGFIRALRLLTAAGAYWRGNERNPMLQRIYGTAFFDPKSLRAHEERLAELEKRDHRKLGAELELFSTMGELGPGLILWHPKGGMIRKVMEEYWRNQHIRGGYEMVYTPHIAKIDLWETSGHTGFYRESMFNTMDIDGQDYQLRPMNCPFHILIYKSRLRSYRDLPLRWAEIGADYRYEKSGVLHGLLRVRGFSMDDAHLFVRPDQLGYEIRRLVNFSLAILRSFGFERFDIYLSTRPEKSIGSDDVWQESEAALREALEDSGLPWETDEGGGAFYGPKIDIKIRDALERAWQCTTIQVDLNLPERFDLTYMGEDGKKHRPIMMHRALLGSLERFFGVLIEHYAGAFPTWLAPVQVVVLSVTGKQEEYAGRVADAMAAAGLRARADLRSDKLGAKIRDARLERIPYMAVVGGREVDGAGVALRGRQEGDMGFMKLEEALGFLEERAREPVIVPSDWEPLAMARARKNDKKEV